MWVRGSRLAPETVRYMQSLLKEVPETPQCSWEGIQDAGIPGSTVHSESEELMCPGPLRALVSLRSKTHWGQSVEDLSFISLGGPD